MEKNSNTTIQKVIDKDAFASYLSVNRGIAQSTLRGVISSLNNFLWWCEENNKEICKQTVEDYLFDRQKFITNGTMNAYIYLFRALDEFFEEKGIQIRLSKGLKKRRIEEKPVEILSLDEINRLFNTSIEDSCNRPAFIEKEKSYLLLTKFLYYSCARFEEAAHIKVEAIDFNGGWITFTETKGRRPRYVPLLEPLLSELKEFVKEKNPEDYIFTNRFGTKIKIAPFWSDLRKRASLAGLPEDIHPHMLRATGASHMAMYGAKIQVISKILGHRNIETTAKHYLHFQQKDMVDALNKNPNILKHAKKDERISQFKQFLDNFGFKEDPELNELYRQILRLVLNFETVT